MTGRRFGWRTWAIFGIMIVVLIVRPRGFFGREGVLE